MAKRLPNNRLTVAECLLDNWSKISENCCYCVLLSYCKDSIEENNFKKINKKSNRNNGRPMVFFAGIYVLASFSKSFFVRSSNFFMTGSIYF